MTTAPYFDRAKIAAAQIIAGFDPEAFTATLEQTSVGISLGDDVATAPQGRACADLLVRLCARLYPSLALLAPDVAGGINDPRARLAADLAALATAINPDITLTDTATTVVHIGAGTPPPAPTVIHVGCDDWAGRLSVEHPCPVGTGPMPIGAGVAACLAAGALFRLLLDPTAPRPNDAELCALPEPLPEATSFTLPDRTALVGAGAIGQAFLWALAHSPVTGALHVVEPEKVDMGNLQRYVLTDMGSVNQPKIQVARGHLEAAARADDGRLEVNRHQLEWAQAMDAVGPTWDMVAVAVDSAEARQAVQASLPYRLLNAWTQTGDLGVSTHDFLNGACCACLYLPVGTSRNEDELVAEALGVPHRLMEVRTLLYNGQPTPDALLEEVADRLTIDPSALDHFRGVPIRDLYIRGICGGGLIPLAHHPGGNPVHVPLAHQSALAGVLLAARLLQTLGGETPTGTEVTRVDVRRNPPEHPHQRAGKDPRGICCCQDPDYIDAYKTLWRSRLA